MPIAAAIRRLSRIDPAGSAVQAARALGIGFGDCAELSSRFAVAAAVTAPAAAIDRRAERPSRASARRHRAAPAR